jgi:hypothetical protein
MRHLLPRRWREAGKRGRMYVYYLGMIGVGMLGFTGYGSPGVTDTLGYTSTTWLFSAGLVVLSVAAIVARRLRAADGEAVFVLGIGAATVVHGAALMSQGSAGWQSGARLLIAILMMWDWADYRRRENDIDQLVNRARGHL